MNAVPPCRADTLERYLFVRAQPTGLQITMGLYAQTSCSLPARPGVQLTIAGRTVDARRAHLHLSANDLPRRVIAPKQPVTAVVRWRNWCGARGPVVLKLTLGGVTVSEQLGSATTSGPPCESPTKTSTIAVSIFVRR